jgi:hypothetical protein
MTVAFQKADLKIVCEKRKKFIVSFGRKTVGVRKVNFRFIHCPPADNFSNKGFSDKTQTPICPAKLFKNSLPDKAHKFQVKVNPSV